MARLTFHEFGSFGVLGMNETNEHKKLYACVERLRDYEDALYNEWGVEIISIKELKMLARAIVGELHTVGELLTVERLLTKINLFYEEGGPK